jgi:hypothetical protein
MRNTITIDGLRTVSSTGNREQFNFVVTSLRQLTDKAVEAIGNAHSFGGQSFSCTESVSDGIYSYTCEATCYCD